MEILNIEFLKALAPMLTGIGIIMLNVILILYYRRRDAEEIMRDSWNIQQQMNLLAAQHVSIRHAYEYGVSNGSEQVFSEEDISAYFYLIFITLNRINFIYRAMNSGLIKRDRAITAVDRIVSIHSNNGKIINYCLSRGYTPEFKQFVNDRIRESHHYQHNSIYEFIAENPELSISIRNQKISEDEQ